MKRAVFAGDRLFRKFPNREFFVTRLHEVGAEAPRAEESFTANQEFGMAELTRVLTGRRPRYIGTPGVLSRTVRGL